MYGDNNLIKYDNRTMIERFTNPSKKWNLGKSIVRTNIPKLIISSAHIIGINLFNTKYFCDSNGKRIIPKSYYHFEVPDKPEAYIKHFYTKTVEEFCDKLKKGHAHFHREHPKYLSSIISKINLFFKINKKTKEKINFIQKCTNINMPKFK
jgi:hypothetical protein